MKKIIIFICVLILTGCNKYNKYELPNDLILEVNDNIFIVYNDEITTNKLIKNTNAKILNKDDLLNNEEIGTFKKEIKLEFNEKEYIKSIEYNIIDNESPIFINAPGYRTIKIFSQFDPCEEIVIGDNYDRNPGCKIEGNYDLSTIGLYDVKYIIYDKSNNINEKNLKINVIEQLPSNKTTTNNSQLNIENVIQNKKNNNTEIGIDVSRWQTDIDFNKVKEAGVSFVIMRIGVNSDIDKDLSIDSYYINNIKNAKDAGLKVGVNVYTSATNKEKAKEHAKWVLDTLNNEKLDFPIAFDWENWNKFGNYNINIHELNETYFEFEKVINEAGYETMLYSSKFYLENIWDTNKIKNIWLAHYTNETNYDGKYIIWQMSNTGKVNGINGNVDIDILYKN